MSQAQDPTLFQFSVLARTQVKTGKEQMQEILERVIRQCLDLDTPIERLQVELAEPVTGEQDGIITWQGNLALVLDMAEDTVEADLGIEDIILSRQIVDAECVCQEIQLGLGSVAHNVEDHQVFDRILDAAHNVSEHQDHHRRPANWYAYPGGGYRFWNGSDWVGEAIEQPPHPHHFQ